MSTEGWPEDRLRSASDVPSVFRHHAGPASDPDRYELLGEAEGNDEAWHVLDHRAAGGQALFTLAALRPAEPPAGAAAEGEPPTGGLDPAEVEQVWRQRAAGLARVRHARLAGVVRTFAGPAPHVPGRARFEGREWSYAVLEQAAGRSVADWLRDDPGAGVEERFTVLATAAGVLQELHRGSEDAPPLVHGDITPRSIRLDGFWPADGVRLGGASLGGLRTGPIQHRPATVYTAPEVRAGALPSTASDVFGFGATAVLVLTGQQPAAGPDGALDPGLVERQLSAAPLTAAHPGLADLLLQALSSDPRRRPDRLPGWVNGMRALVEPRSAPGLPGEPRGHAHDALPAAAAAATVRPAVPRARTRPLPHRPVLVVVGALVLATAGTAAAITAIQQGRLENVPNPVAIVQPPPVSDTPLPTSSAAVPPPAPAASSGSSSTGGGSAGSGSAARRPSSRATSTATAGTPAATTPPPATTTPPVPTAPSTTPPAATPPGATPPPGGSLPGASIPPVVPPPPPSVALIPPETGPAPVTTTGTTPPATPTTTTTPPVTPSTTPTPTTTPTRPPTRSPVPTATRPGVDATAFTYTGPPVPR